MAAFVAGAGINVGLQAVLAKSSFTPQLQALTPGALQNLAPTSPQMSPALGVVTPEAGFATALSYYQDNQQIDALGKAEDKKAVALAQKGMAKAEGLMRANLPARNRPLFSY